MVDDAKLRNNRFTGTDNVIGYLDIEPEIEMFLSTARLSYLFLYGAALPQP